MRPYEQHRATLAVEAAVLRAIAKLKIALGYHEKRERVINFPNIPHAYAVIDELARLIDEKELETPLATIGMRADAVMALHKIGIESLEELIDMTEKEFKSKHGVGTVVLSETKRALKDSGFAVRRQ